MIKNYVKKGGNIWINVHLSADMRDYEPTKVFLKELGASPLLFNLSDTSKEITLPPWWIKFAWTENIKSAFFETKGKNLWYPTGIYKMGPRSFIFELSPEWKKIVTTENTAEAKPIFVRIPYFDRIQENKTKRGKLPLLGLREFGSGKIAISGFYHSYVFSDPFAPALARVMTDKGYGNKKSCWLSLFENLTKYLTSNYKKIKRDRPFKTKEEMKVNPFSQRSKELPEYNWNNAKYPEQVWKKGGIFIISEKYSINDYAEKGKEAGLDFLVLIKDLKNLDEKKLNDFKIKCKKISSINFKVIPGIYFQDLFGDNLIATGNHITFPDSSIWDKKKKCLKPPSTGKIPGALDQMGDAWLHFVLEQLHHSAIVASLLHNKNGIPYDDYRDYNSIAVITTKNGEIIDSAVDKYLRLQDRGENLIPIAVHFIDSPEIIKRISKNGFLIYTYRNPETFFSRDHMLDNPAIFVSNGPEINYWMWKGPRDFENTGNPFDLSRWYFFVKLAVSSKNGLKEVKIYDGQDIDIDFTLSGKRDFSIEIPYLHDKQKNLVPVIKDTEGKIAIGAEVFDRSHIAEEFMCSDRNNQLFYSMQRRKNGIDMSRSFNAGVTPNKGPWSGEISPWSALISDPPHRLSVIGFDGAPSGGSVSYVFPQDILVKKYGELKLRSNPYRIFNSSDVGIGKAIINSGYKPENKVSNVWHTILPVFPTKYIDAEFKNTYFIPKQEDDFPVFLTEINLKFKKDIPANQNFPLSFPVVMLDPRKAELWQIRTSENKFLSGKRTQGKISVDKEILFHFGKGSYIRFSEAPTGSMTVLSLSDNLYLYVDRYIWRGYIGLKKGILLKSGKEYKFKFLFVGEPFNSLKSNTVAESIYNSFFRNNLFLKINKGELIEKTYPIFLNAENGIVEFEKNSDTYVSIPIIIKNLNPSISAYVYFHSTGKYRPIGVDSKGNGYLSLRGKYKEKITAGNLIICKNKDLKVTVIPGEKRKFVCYLLNPTDKIIKTLIKTADFPFLKNFSKKIEIMPHSLKKISF